MDDTPTTSQILEPLRLNYFSDKKVHMKFINKTLLLHEIDCINTIFPQRV